MIIHFCLGNDDVDPTKVFVKSVRRTDTNNKGNKGASYTKYLTLDAINQQLKLNAKFMENKRITNEDIHITASGSEEDAPNSWSAAVIRFKAPMIDEEIDPNLRLRWANNSKTFSPILVGGKSQDDEDVIIYVTLPTSYKVLGYYSACSILHTYFVKDLCTGCVIVAKKSELMQDEQPVIFNCTFFDYSDKTFKTAEINIDADINASVTYGNVPKAKIKSFAEKNSKYKQSMRFRIRSNNGNMITSAFITNSESYDELKEILDKKVTEKKAFNPVIFVINDVNSEDDINDALDFVQNDNYKAITLYNISIPRDSFKSRKIHNIFNYDKENDTVVGI